MEQLANDYMSLLLKQIVDLQGVKINLCPQMKTGAILSDNSP